MISVVIATLDDEATLAAALADLVPAAIDGLVRELVVADAGSRDATLAVAEDAGAVIVRGSLAEAVAVAKADWILLLPAAPCLAPGWERAVEARMRSGGAARLVGRWPWRPAAGVLAPRLQLDGGLTGASPLRQALRRLRGPVGALKVLR